jgi:hypothetical protein
MAVLVAAVSVSSIARRAKLPALTLPSAGMERLKSFSASL